MHENKQELTPNRQMQEMLARMERMQTELDTLKARTNSLPQPTPSSTVTTTRRKTLKRLGLALLGGATAATVTGFSVSEAKVTISSQNLGTSTSKAGAIITLPGAPAPTGSPPNSGQYYGLIASSNSSSSLDLSQLPPLNVGVYGSSSIYGIYGTGNLAGVTAKGGTNGVYSTGYSAGVYGIGRAGGVFVPTGNNVTGTLPDNTIVGIIGVAGTNLDQSGFSEGYIIGVYGLAPTTAANNYAGYFEGNVRVNRDLYVAHNLSKAGGSFKIDHPLDPANKYLYHSFVESPDMMNIYNGLVTLDDRGEAVIEMPNWFDALNSDFRYQLTCLESYSPVYIAQEITNRQFKIAGGKSNQRVSWQITGIRQDAYAQAHRIPVEEAKSGNERGKYLHPEVFGQPSEMAVNPKPIK